MQDKIDIQRKKIQAGNPTIDLIDSCRVGEGILQFSLQEDQAFIQKFDKQKADLESCFFIPASGSGSRMFSALYSFLNNEKDAGAEKVVDELILNITSLAAYEYLSDEWKSKLEKGDFDKTEFVTYLINEDGLDLGKLPKGLIPFHHYGSYITNPFQEHLLQGSQIANTDANFHFTINRAFEASIKTRIERLERKFDIHFNCSFSEQDPSTHSVAFNGDLEPAVDGNGYIITRPAGHGTLIKNLNEISTDLIFIRNIDNMQHQGKAGTSIQRRKMLAGVLLQFQSDVFELIRQLNAGENVKEKAEAFNERYAMRLPASLIEDSEALLDFLNRPQRVCGMVPNEGEPGGGPFWVNLGDIPSRQIIEKSQISDDLEQLKLMEMATHFNPVELVCGVKNFEGRSFDLLNFIDDTQYFVVNKTQEGQAIQYIEQPGLWNGAMANWLTLFVEIEAACFSPVKTFLDLLKPAHQPN